MRHRRVRKTASARLNIRKFKTTIELANLVTDATGKFLTTYGASIKDIDNTAGNNYGGIGMQSALRSLYEEYKFDAIKFTFVPNYTQAASGVGAGNSGSVSYAINRAPAAPGPSSFVDVLRQNDCKVQLATKGFAVTVRKPHWEITAPLGLQVNTGPVSPGIITNAVAQTSSSFCSTRDYSLPSGGLGQPGWFGLDVAVEAAPINAVVYRVYATYYMTFRNQN